MFRYHTFSIMICALLLWSNCKQKNALSQNESSLLNELTTLSALEVDPFEKTGKGTFLNIPEESRKPEPNSPPIVLDILKARSDVRNIQLADLFSNIRYIPIDLPDANDSIKNKFGEFDFLITPNSIIASNFTYGISQFDLSGNYISSIVKSDFYFTALPGRNLVMVTGDDMRQFIGNAGEVHAVGDRIFYQYHNNPDGYGAMMMYDTDPSKLSPLMVGSSETTIDKPKGSEVFQFPMNDPKFGAISSIMSFNSFPINEEEWVTTNSVLKASKSESFIYSTNIYGDTLTKFKNYDPIRNFTGGNYRAVDSRGDQYTYLGIQHVRQSHNDTIYMIVQANRLIPKYVLDFGEKGIQSTLEAIDPKVSLKNKFIIKEFIESNNFLFITYTQNAPSPNAAKRKEVFYNACIYDKLSKELYHVYIDQSPHMQQGQSWPKTPRKYLVNNLDDGPFFWPKSTSHDGRPFTWIKRDDSMNKKWNHNTDYLLLISY